MEKSKALIFMHSLLKHAKDSGASDIFITTGFAPAIKVDGKIAPVSNQTLSSEQSKEFVYSLLWASLLR
jgi:twitching motility protein PilU